MNDIYKLFGTSEKNETEGVILEFSDTLKFKLARAGGSNTKYQRCMAKLCTPYGRRMQLAQKAGGQPDKDLIDALEKIHIEAFAETVLLGWQGVKGKDGKEIKFSKKAAMELLTDLPDLYVELSDFAGQMSNFREDDLEAIEKN